MSELTTRPVADEVLPIPPVHEAESCAAGIRRLSLFGSVARGEVRAESDVDLAAEIDPSAGMDLIRLVGLEHQIAGWVGREVHITPEPVEKQRLRANIEMDRKLAF